MQEDIVLERIEADNQIRLQHRDIMQALLITGQLPIELIHNLQFTVGKNLLSICETPRDPTIEEMTCPCQAGRFDNASILAGTRANEEYQPTSFTHARNNLGGAA